MKLLCWLSWHSWVWLNQARTCKACRRCYRQWVQPGEEENIARACIEPGALLPGPPLCRE